MNAHEMLYYLEKIKSLTTEQIIGIIPHRSPILCGNEENKRLLILRRTQ